MSAIFRRFLVFFRVFAIFISLRHFSGGEPQVKTLFFSHISPKTPLLKPPMVVNTSIWSKGVSLGGPVRIPPGVSNHIPGGGPYFGSLGSKSNMSPHAFTSSPDPQNPPTSQISKTNWPKVVIWCPYSIYWWYMRSQYAWEALQWVLRFWAGFWLEKQKDRPPIGQ